MSRLPTWVLSVAGVTYGTELPSGRRERGVFDLGDRVTGFEFDSEEGKQDKVTLVVENRDLAYFDSPVLMKGTDFTFLYGYAGQLAPGGEAKVEGVRGFEQLRIEAYGLATGLTTVQKTRKWSMMSRSAIVRQIAVDNGIARAIVTPSVSVETISQVGRTDWQFLLELAEPLGYSTYFTIERGVRVLNWRFRDHRATPARIFEWGQPGRALEAGSPMARARGPRGSRSVPLLAFTIDDSKTKGKPSEVQTTGYDPDNRTPIRGTGRRETAQQTVKDGPATEVATPSESGGKNEACVSVVPTAHASADRVREEANTRYQLMQEDQFRVKASVEGDPTLTIGQIVEIAAVPSFLAGNYYVRGVRHTIGGDGYRTTLKLSRNAVGLTPISPEVPIPPAPGPVNTKSARDADPDKLVPRSGLDRDRQPVVIFGPANLAG